MRFVRAVWKLLVGVKDALVLLAMLLFFGVLWAGLRARPKPIGEGILLVNLDGSLVEQPARASAQSLVAGSSSVSREHRLRDVVAAVDAAADDDRVKAIALDLERFVGGATEETIIARVGEGIVSTIGSANSYKDVLENPDRISKTVLDKALDSHTAFEILSIDIADVDVGENVGAK